MQKLIYIPSQVYYDILYPRHTHEIWSQKKKANMSQPVKLKHHLEQIKTYLNKDKHLKQFVKLTPMAAQSRTGMQL